MLASSRAGATGIEHDRRVCCGWREARGPEFGDGRGRLRQIISELAPQRGRQTESNENFIHDFAAEFVSPECVGIFRAEHSRARRVLWLDERFAQQFY